MEEQGVKSKEERAENVAFTLRLQAIEQVLKDNGLVKSGQLKEIALERLERSIHDEEEKRVIKEKFI